MTLSIIWVGQSYMVEISQGERLGQPCKLLFPGAPLLGILSLFLSVQQLCSGGLIRLAKPPENGEASIGGISNQQVSGKARIGQLETCTSMSRTGDGEHPREKFRKRNHCLGMRPRAGNRAVMHSSMDLAFLCTSGVTVAGDPFGHLCAGVNCGEMDSYALTVVLLPFASSCQSWQGEVRLVGVIW